MSWENKYPSHLLGSQSSQELVLLLQSLETSVTVLGRSVDELEVEWFSVGASGRRNQTLSQGDGSLLRSSNASLDHDPVFIHFTIVREATNRGDALLGEIRLSRSGLNVTLLANAKDSLVDFGTVVITLLTSTSDSVSDSGRVPSSNTGDLSQSTVSLSWESGDTPSSNNTSISVTLGSSANVNDFTLCEDGGDINFLLEQGSGEVNFGSNISTVDLDLQKVGNLLSELDLADLGMSQNTNNLAVLFDAVQFGSDQVLLLRGLLGVLSECLSLGSVPVLVESALEIIRKMVSPHGGESAETVGGLDVANNADNDHGGTLQDGNSLHCFLLVKF